MRWAAALLLILAAVPAVAEQVVARLSSNRVAITTGFTGTEIFIYGAVMRAAPRPEEPLDVIVVVMGPSERVMVRQKVRRYGVWVKDQGIVVDRAPSFFAVATTRPFYEAISHTEDLRHKVGLKHLVRLIDAQKDGRYAAEYADAVIRLRENAGLYLDLPGAVTIDRETLFQTRVSLPASLVDGAYTTRIFLLRDRKVIDIHESSITVQKVGVERLVYNLAHENGLLYGILALAVGFVAGWIASALFRLLP